jgi:cell division protein FtsN
MSKKKMDGSGDGVSGWLASLIGVAVLVTGGFLLGLVAGVVSQEPTLVVGHLTGRSEEATAWTPSDPSGLAADDLELSGTEDLPLEASRQVDLAVTADATPPPTEEWAAPGAWDAPEPGSEALPEDLPAERRPSRRTLPPVAAAPPGTRDISSLPTASAAPDSPGAPRAGYAVQVGAFASGSAAGTVEARLLARGFDAYVVPPDAAGDGRWRVRVGPVGQKSEAEAVADRLKREERLPTWVLSEEGG